MASGECIVIIPVISSFFLLFFFFYPFSTDFGYFSPFLFLFFIYQFSTSFLYHKFSLLSFFVCFVCFQVSFFSPFLVYTFLSFFTVYSTFQHLLCFLISRSSSPSLLPYFFSVFFNYLNFPTLGILKVFSFVHSLHTDSPYFPIFHCVLIPIRLELQHRATYVFSMILKLRCAEMGFGLFCVYAFFVNIPPPPQPHCITIIIFFTVD